MTMWFHGKTIKAIFAHRWTTLCRIVIASAVVAIWVIAGGAWFVGNDRVVQHEAAAQTIEMFLVPDVSPDIVSETMKKVARMPSVQSVSRMPEENLWQTLSDVTTESEELRSMVTLPTVLQVKVKAVDANAEHFSASAVMLSKAYAAICTDVVWPKALIQSFDKQRENLRLMGIVVTVLTIIVLLLMYTVVLRSEILTSAEELAALSSAGATSIQMAAPHIIASGLAGMVGTIVGVCAVFAVRMQWKAPWLLAINTQEYWVVGGYVLLGTIVLICWQHLRTAGAFLRIRRAR